MKNYVWNPWEVLSAHNENGKYAVIILNRPICSRFKSDLLLNVWNNATVRITVDGGTHRWLSWLQTNGIDLNTVTSPELITGDMDSVEREALEYFTTNDKTKVIITEDQNETDFTKSLIELQRYITNMQLQLDDVIAFTATSGRFDQILASINTLYKARTIIPNVNVYILASDSLTWLLPAGNHTIDIPAKLRLYHEWCAMIPIGTPCTVTTTGLKWNLNGGHLEFGGMVSTSNTYDGAPEVTILADDFVVWSMGIENYATDPLSNGI